MCRHLEGEGYLGGADWADVVGEAGYHFVPLKRLDLAHICVLPF